MVTVLAEDVRTAATGICIEEIPPGTNAEAKPRPARKRSTALIVRPLSSAT